MRTFIAIILCGLIQVGCGSSTSTPPGPSKTTTPTLRSPRVDFSRSFGSVHLRLLSGKVSEFQASSTIGVIGGGGRVNYFAFIEKADPTLQSRIERCTSWVEAENVLKAYKGKKVLARQMANGKVMYETNDQPWMDVD